MRVFPRVFLPCWALNPNLHLLSVWCLPKTSAQLLSFPAAAVHCFLQRLGVFISCECNWELVNASGEISHIISGLFLQDSLLSKTLGLQFLATLTARVLTSVSLLSKNVKTLSCLYLCGFYFLIYKLANAKGWRGSKCGLSPVHLTSLRVPGWLACSSVLSNCYFTQLF